MNAIVPSDVMTLTTINFHGAALVVRAGDSPATTLVAMRPVVEGMGLSWAAQFVKLKAHPVLGPTISEIEMVAEDGKSRAMTALPLSRLHFWLATIQPNKVKPEIRERVIAFQTEAADALFEHFFGQPARERDALSAAVLERLDTLSRRLDSLTSGPASHRGRLERSEFNGLSLDDARKLFLDAIGGSGTRRSVLNVMLRPHGLSPADIDRIEDMLTLEGVIRSEFPGGKATQIIRKSSFTGDSAAAQLLGWLLRRGGAEVSAREILRLGPSPVREQSARERAVAALIEEGKIIEIFRRPRRFRVLN